MLNTGVLVLNNNYEPLGITRLKRALCLLYLEKAEIVEIYEELRIRAGRRSFPAPSVVRLHHFVKLNRRSIPLTRKNVMRRDRYTCQYCGTTKGPMTVDHIVPKRRGGKDVWENLVCACVKCNNKKGNRTPEEAGMRLLKRPKAPYFFTFIHSLVGNLHPTWRQYLFLS